MDSLNILYESNTKFDWGNFNWSNYRGKLGTAVSRYNDANARGDADPAKFLREHLPAYWQSVRALNTYQWVEVRDDDLPSSVGYDVGIFLVGFSSLPIVLSIAEIQPRKKIYFIHSDDTERKCAEIILRLKEMLVNPPLPFQPLIDPSDTELLIDRVANADLRQIADASDPISTFREIKVIIDDVHAKMGKDIKMALDLTGGKKTMIGGGFTAGSIYFVSPECDMFYVDSLEYDPDLGAPTPGSEFLSLLDNPYDVYDVQSLGKAEILFYEHNYEAAVHLWREVQEKLGEHADRYGLQNEHAAVEKDLNMADCYSLWDAFDYKTAFDESAQPSGHLWDYTRKHVSAQINVLYILRAIEDQETLFADEARVIHWAVDRYQNAVRRYESDLFNDAIVRFTQVVEILCIYRIYQIQGTGELTDRSHNVITCSEVVLDEHWSVTKLIRFLFSERPNEMYEERYRIANLDKRLQKDEYGYSDVRDITGLIKHRNIFVHVQGTPAWQDLMDNAEKLRELALKFLENFSKDYCCDKGLSFHELLELHRFRR